MPLREYSFETSWTDDTTQCVGIVGIEYSCVYPDVGIEYSCVYPDERFYRKEDVDKLLQEHGIKLEDL